MSTLGVMMSGMVRLVCVGVDVRGRAGDRAVFARGPRVQEVHALLLPGGNEPYCQSQQCAPRRGVA